MRKRYSCSDASFIVAFLCVFQPRLISCLSATCDSATENKGENTCDTVTASKSSPKSYDTDDTKAKGEPTDFHSDTCALYLGKSSIPNAGVGIYTSIGYEKGDKIGEGELLVPITEWEEDMTTVYSTFYDWLIYDVQWSGTVDQRFYYDSAYEPSLFYPGFGAQINCHMGLNNVHHDEPEINSTGLHRARDPGAGAFTYWHNMPNLATRKIRAGEELFTSYGENWFDDRDMDDIPFSAHYRKADTAVEAAAKSFRHDLWKDKSEDEKADAWNLVLKKEKHPRVLSALPKSHTDIDEATRLGTARFSLGGELSFRTQEWFDANAICMDTLFTKKSTIPQAGRGGFLKRPLTEGSIVMPVPLLQLDRNVFVVPNTYQKISGKAQLLMNYALGHDDSEVFLLPYNALVNFINHGNSAGDNAKANVKLRWSESFNRAELIDLDVKELLESSFGLIMELVALRDLEEGEELFLDYGSQWEEAWEQHMDDWTPLPNSESYQSAEELIHLEKNIRTEEEQQMKPYPENIQTACMFYHTEDTDYDIRPLTADELKEENFEGPANLYLANWTKPNNDCLRYCKILSRYTEEESGEKFFYNVEVLPQTTNLHDDCYHTDEEKLFVDKIPEHAVTIVDEVLTRDHHLVNAFRHPIGLPDELLPTKWRGRYAKTEEDETNKESDDEKKEE
eukprot:CAMPEP_0194404764 /NCGR_PEP_ID=MMETSP0176-20130528/3278_1 /TAXON_ID=216777 /ORGANISM="Proboscia alata, Strain PI-D3" /LENGTH=677 /DNA_ID=CAMNT_0039203269 /DNA_START=30 /DNA_END=2063 /DNA_ORIENTATION=+